METTTRKVKLNLDNLRVDTFATTEAGPLPSGTVHGRDDTARTGRGVQQRRDVLNG